MENTKNYEEFNPETHTILTKPENELRFIVCDHDTGEVLEEGVNGKGYQTPEEAMKAYRKKANT